MKRRIIIISTVAILVLACLIGIIVTGAEIGWGPFGYLEFDKEEREIIKKYNVESNQNTIVFYGASNFRLWKNMEEDFGGLIVQNHAFGGSTDKDLVERADTLLYPYCPQIVVFQTGSNDYSKMTGDIQEKVMQSLEYKEYMFNLFHEQLPSARFVVVSGIIMPGRSEDTQTVLGVNDGLKLMCEKYDYLYFVDSEDLTYDGQNYKTELFIKDEIHLTQETRKTWCDNYIKPVIEDVILKEKMQNLYK